MTYALSRFMRRIFFFASNSFRYSLSLSYGDICQCEHRCSTDGLGTYEFNLFDLLFQLLVFALILYVLCTRSDARDMRFGLLLRGGGSEGYLVVHLEAL